MSNPLPPQMPLFPPTTSAQASSPPATTTPAPDPSRELEVADLLKWPSSDRINKLNELRLKMDQTGNLTSEECRMGVRLLHAERTARAGAKGGSKEKAAAAGASFKPVSLADL